MAKHMCQWIHQVKSAVDLHAHHYHCAGTALLALNAEHKQRQPILKVLNKMDIAPLWG